jgi:hypothetical protein
LAFEPERGASLKKEPMSEAEAKRTAGILMVLVVGIALNTLGVVLVALRGIGWSGFALMLAGIALLLLAAVSLATQARRKQPEEDGKRRSR